MATVLSRCLLSFFYNWQAAIDYLNGRNYDEAIAVVVIMLITSSLPLMALTEESINFFAKKFNRKASACWLIVMTLGPLCGSLITEAGAMVLTCMLLVKHFYPHKVSDKLAHATLGALFTNVSLGGILTGFASPRAMMVSGMWDRDTWFVLSTFGWKSALSILLTNLTLYFFFRKEFHSLDNSELNAKRKNRPEIPSWLTSIHFILLGVVDRPFSRWRGSGPDAGYYSCSSPLYR